MAINPYRKGGPDVPVDDGGTGASDPSGARANLGAGDLTAAGHASLNHTGLPGVPSGMQTRFYSVVFNSVTSTWNSGTLGFTPKFILVQGIATHNNDGTPTASWTGNLASVFFGCAISGNDADAGVVTAQQHNAGSANDSCSAFNVANDWVGGNPPAGDVVGNAVTLSFTRRIQVDNFASSGVSLSVEGGTMEARLFVLVVGA